MKYRLIHVSKQQHGPNADYLVITEDGQVAHRRPDEAGDGRHAIVDYFGTRVTDEGVSQADPWPMLDNGDQWCQDYEKDYYVDPDVQEYDILLDIFSFLQPTVPFGGWIRDDSIFPDLFSESRFPTLLLNNNQTPNV